MTDPATRHLDVLSFGEALVDFLPDRRGPLCEVDTFRRVVGGAPANVAVGLARLGRSVAFVGKVGADGFGEYLRSELAAEGVDVSGLGLSSQAKTGVTFVSLDESGDRSFMFFREPSADLLVGPDDIDEALVARSLVVHLGSNLMTEALPLSATMRLLDAADAHDCVVSCDPNLRLHLWPSGAGEARTQIDRLIERCDIIKLNDDELAFVADGDSAEALWHERLRPHGALALLVTRAERGAEVFCGDTHVFVEAPETEVVDTTGAGDGFMSGLLAAITEVFRADEPTEPGPRELKEQLARCDATQWAKLLEFACAAGSRACQTLGATPGLARRDELPDLTS